MLRPRPGFLLYCLNSTPSRRLSTSPFTYCQYQFKRYVCDIGRRDCYNVDWVDFTRTNGTLEVADSDDLKFIARELPRNDLFKTRIKVSLGSAKAVMDQNSFLCCLQLNAPCTGLWRGDHQGRMRRSFGLFLSTAVMTHRAPSPM